MMSSVAARGTVICAVLTYAFSSPSLAAGPGPAASQPVTSQPGGRDSKLRLAVLDFKVEGMVEASGSGVAAALVRKEFNASNRYDLMDREMMRERMAEKDWAATAECDQVRCLVKYGTSLDVNKIIGGSISSFGDTWFVEIRFVDVNTGREEKTFARKHSGKMEDSLDIVAEGARELLGTATGKPADDQKPQQQAPSGKTLTLDLGGGVKMDLVLIPAGTFTMGSNEYDDEKPPHEVRISKAFYTGNSDLKTHPAGQKKANAWGLCDMHGNVCEWCADWYGSYNSSDSQTEPEGASTAIGCALRGGSWDCALYRCRSAARSRPGPAYRSLNVGLRVAVGTK